MTVAEVGSSGGTVTSEQAGVKIDVPAGALDGNTTLTIEPIDTVRLPRNDATIVSSIVRLGPEGTMFKVPVTVTFDVDLSKLPAGVTLAQLVVLRAPAGTSDFVSLPTSASGPSTVQASTSHFSDFLVAYVPGGIMGCGDAMCGGAESCSTCAADCGACHAETCGNGTCGSGESCSSCPGDCGQCQVPSSSYTDWVASYATAFCQREATCVDTPLSAAVIADCEAEIRQELFSDAPPAMVAAGKLSFDSAWAQRCSDALAAWPACVGESIAAPWNCFAFVIRGSVGENGECSSTEQCGAGLRCDRAAVDDSPCIGGCVSTRVPIGGACRDSLDCAIPTTAGHLVVCADPTSTGTTTCIDVAPQAQAEANQPCSYGDQDDFTGVLCEPGTFCDWDPTAGTICLPNTMITTPVGQACGVQYSESCAAYEGECIQDSQGSQTYTCQAGVTVTQVGGDCDYSWGNFYNRGYRECDPTLNLHCASDGKCAAGNGTAGSECYWNTQCNGGLICNNGLCQALLADGADCNPDADICLSGRCDYDTQKCAAGIGTLDPGSAELCDNSDNDCNGLVDDGLAQAEQYLDQDRDGHGSTTTEMVCVGNPDYSSTDGDCEDWNSSIYPGAPEVCDTQDNDCDGAIDEGLPTANLYLDADHDTYGTGSPVSVCVGHADYAATTGDCDDYHAESHPGGTEVCDARDNDCDGTVDDGFTTTQYYADYDEDGYGRMPFGGTVSPDPTCVAPSAWHVTTSGDCDDNDPSSYPGNPELCDALDNDCNGVPDDGLDPVTYPLTQWYLDQDNDGYGNPAYGYPRPLYPTAYPTCMQPTYQDFSFADNNTDCNDSSPTMNPGAGNCP